MDSALTSGNFTVFAPTDAAFAKLPAGTVEALLKDKTRLSQILVRDARHVAQLHLPFLRLRRFAPPLRCSAAAQAWCSR
jgi:hypothetical protein